MKTLLAAGEKLVVKPIPTERVTEGGIVVPENAAKRQDWAQMRAKVISLGPLAFMEERKGKQHDFIPKPGSEVYVARYGGVEVEFEGEKYRLINDQEVTALVYENGADN